MRISRKVFWIFFTIIFVTLLLAANQIITYYAQQHLNLSIGYISRLQTQVRLLDQQRLALFLPEREFSRSEYDRLATASSLTSRQLAESMDELSDDLLGQLNNMNFNLNNFRSSLLELAETRELTARLETSIHKILSGLHQHEQIEPEHREEHEQGRLHTHDGADVRYVIEDLQLHFQISSFVHHRQYKRLPRIKETVAHLQERSQDPVLNSQLELLVQLLEDYYQGNLQLVDRKQFVETSATNFLELTQQLLVRLEEHSMQRQQRISQFSLLVSFVGLLAAIFFWYRIRVYLRRFLFNQNQVMQAIQTGSNNLQLAPQSEDELGDLTVAMKDLSVELNKKKADLQDSEQKYRTLIENLADWVWETNLNHRFVYCSEASESITGHSQASMLGRKYLTLSKECEERAVLEHIEDHFRERTPFTNIERKICCADGTIKNLIASGTPLFDATGSFTGFRGVDRDISELVRARESHEQLEMKLQHAQKMESIGRLAGGVAHDFNNILSAIIGYSELVMNRLEPDHRCYRYIKEIRSSGERAAGLTKQLLAFSRKQTRSPQNLDLAKELRALEDMLRRLVGERIDLQLEIGDDIWPVLMDKSQLEQVVVNLMVNAKDALPDGGEIIISVTNCPPDCSCRSQENAGLPAEDYVQLTVSDNGCGIPEELLQNIFDPFFTTKGHDKGTGLGLAMVYGIVTQNAGDIQVVSEPGKGSKFHVLLPRSSETASVPVIKETDRELRAGKETILFVEDESALLRMHAEFLTSLGYQLLTASDGLEALELFQQTDQIDLLITDVIMPKMGGIELAEKLKQLNPQLKVLYTSGYTDQEFFADGILQEGINFIYKPATPIDIARMLEKLLG